MKSTSKKSTGLLGGFDFQPIFLEQTLSRSEPKKLKQAKEVQRLIEQGDVSSALAEAGLTKKKSQCRNRIRALQAEMASVPSALPSL